MTELQQKYCNASITYNQCGGHKKAERNKILKDVYEQELKNSGERVPNSEEVSSAGVFNGPGAS